MIAPNAAEDVEQLELFSLAGRGVERCNHFVKYFAISYRIRHTVILLLSSSNLRHLLKRNENMSIKDVQECSWQFYS